MKKQKMSLVVRRKISQKKDKNESNDRKSGQGC